METSIKLHAGKYLIQIKCKTLVTSIIREGIDNFTSDLPAAKALVAICTLISGKGYGLSSYEIFNKLMLLSLSEIHSWIDWVWGQYITAEDLRDICLFF